MTDVYANTYTPPEWLDQNFIQAALREGLRRGSLQLLDYKIRPATNVGDNFVSQMFRASTVIGSKRKDPEDLSIVIKSLPIGENVEKLVNETQLFVKETTMLSETLPFLQDILNKAGDFPRLFAKLYYQQGPPNDLIILEDLCKAGYKAPNRLLGLNLDHCILVMESLAIFHAASLVAIEKRPDIKVKYDKGLWHRSNEDFLKNFLVQGIQSLAEFAEVWDEIPVDFSKKLLQSKDIIMKNVFDVCDRVENDFNVLLHGDAWTNNFMFKYNGEKPIGVKFVDFQITSYNHAVTDLLYFIFSSPQDDIGIKNIDKLLRIYHNKLVEVCMKLNYNLEYSFNDLKNDFLKRLLFGFCVAITVFPFTTAQSTEAVEINDFLNGSSENNQFKSKKFQDGMKIMLPYFLENGLFD